MKTLLIIDLQKQFAGNNEKYQKCLDFISNKQPEYDRAIATYFKQSGSNPNYRTHLNWTGCSKTSESSLEFYNKDWQGIVMPKHSYGSRALDVILKQIKCKKDDRIDIIGCNVTAICFQLWDAGFTNIRILTDYIYNTIDFDDEMWLKYMESSFGDCVITGGD